MTEFELLFLLGAAVIAGAINAIAGGGGLLVFPALLLAGVAPVSANASSAAGIWIGMVMSGVAYRQEISLVAGKLWPVTLASLAGGGLGAWLLLHFSDEGFAGVVPYLVAIGTLVFAFSPQLVQFSQRFSNQRFSNQRFFNQRFFTRKERIHQVVKRQAVKESVVSPTFHQPVLIVGQGLISIYGGFFGGGAGILMLTLLSLTNPGRIQTLQAVKVWMAVCINAAALSYFVFADIISWRHVLLVAAGTTLGGYSSASVAERVPASWLRRLVIVIGSLLTLYFFG